MFQTQAQAPFWRCSIGLNQVIQNEQWYDRLTALHRMCQGHIIAQAKIPPYPVNDR